MLGIERIIQTQVMHAVTSGSQLARKGAHGGEHRDDLLGMMTDVVGLLSNFLEDRDRVRIDSGEPAVPAVELITEHQLQAACRPMIGRQHAVRDSDRNSSEPHPRPPPTCVAS